MISKCQRAEDTAAHHRPHAFGCVLGHQFARRDPDALNEDVGRHDSGEREAENPCA